MKANKNFTVAIENETGEIVNVWEGHRFRAYNDQKVHQYKVSACADKSAAVDSVKRLWRHLNSVIQRP
jgi:hypothetical protein